MLCVIGDTLGSNLIVFGNPQHKTDHSFATHCSITRSVLFPVSFLPINPHIIVHCVLGFVVNDPIPHIPLHAPHQRPDLVNEKLTPSTINEGRREVSETHVLVFQSERRGRNVYLRIQKIDAMGPCEGIVVILVACRPFGSITGFSK